jgi:hypothetical protein
MAKKAKTISETEPVVASNEPVNLGALLSKKPIFQAFRLWIVGDTPLIVHAWSKKAKDEMLAKQVGATRGGKEKRDPQQDFVNSLYPMGEDEKTFGFPATGFKNAVLSSAHKDKGVARSSVMQALWINADIVSVRPALAGAVCDMPLIRIFGSEPECREDMTKIGSGLNRVANLAYRAQFRIWAMRISGRFNGSVLTADQLAFLIQEAGLASGLGEWRNERRGVFGSFHLADGAEELSWEAFAAGNGDLPAALQYAMAAE